MDSKKKILITGATGFLGSALLKRGEELKALLYPTASQKRKLDKLTVEKMDLTNFSEVKRVVAKVKPTIVYHLGALVNLARDFKVAEKCLEVNAKGILYLLEALRGIKLDRFIYANSEEVYGDGPIPFQESQVIRPPSPYAISKAAGEYFGRIYAQTLGFKFISFRIGTMYGPNQPARRFFPQIINRALKNEEIPLTSGKKKRDYVYINDVVNTLILAKDADLKKNFTVINIGGGIAYSLEEVVKKILYICKSQSKILLGKIPERTLEADEWLMDINRAQKLLAWKPKTTLDQGLKKMIKSIRVHG